MKIYSNYPCRLTLAELDCDLPCKADIFSSRHPFMQDESVFAPRLTISRAFALLFEGKVKKAEAEASTSVASIRPNATDVAAQPVDLFSDGDLTVFDLFILIRFLYTYIHACIMNLSLNLPTTTTSLVGGRTSNGPKSRSINLASGPTTPTTQDIQGALERWRQLWQAVCSHSSDQSMKTAGMYRNGFHFWLVAQLIVTREAAVDVITGMEVNCEDALTKLKVLFQNDGEQE